MSRRLCAVLLGLAAVLGLAAACTPRPGAPDAPNVLLYVADTLRADALGCYGRLSAGTPRIDAWAREAIVFESAWSSAPWTRPSMASLLTGLHPPRHGVEGRRDAIPEATLTLAEVLGQRGWHSAFVTANPNAGSFFGFGQGFSRVFELYGRRRAGPVSGRELIARADEVTDRALRWVSTARRPFLLVVLAVDPHAPYDPPARFAPRFAPDWARAEPGADAGDAARERALYQGEVAAIDAAFGTLLDGLAELGELERTVVAFTADHGEELGEHGRRGHGDSLADEALHVPLILRPAGDAGRGARVTQPVQLVDVYPTLLAHAGVARPEDLDGVALPSVQTDRPALSSLKADGRDRRVARDTRWKLVWDRGADGLALYDLRRGDGARVDASEGSRGAVARARLSDALLALDDGPASDRNPVGSPPPAERDSLRALGYVD